MSIIDTIVRTLRRAAARAVTGRFGLLPSPGENRAGVDDEEFHPPADRHSEDSLPPVGKFW